MDSLMKPRMFFMPRANAVMGSSSMKSFPWHMLGREDEVMVPGSGLMTRRGGTSEQRGLFRFKKRRESALFFFILKDIQVWRTVL